MKDSNFKRALEFNREILDAPYCTISLIQIFPNSTEPGRKHLMRLEDSQSGRAYGSKIGLKRSPNGQVLELSTFKLTQQPIF